MENGFFVSLYNGFHRETPYIIRDFTMKTNVEKITKIVNVIVIFLNLHLNVSVCLGIFILRIK